jgi:hypothetical protein
MSDTLTLPPNPAIDSPSDPATASPEVSIIGTVERSTASTAMPFPATDARALHELVTAALSPAADETTRAGAREVWAHLAQSLATAQPIPPPIAPVHPAVMPAAPTMPAMPPMPTALAQTSPIAVAARALRQMPPDQLLELVVQRLRAALPAGTTAPEPKGIQFHLVPSLPPPPSKR